MSMCEIYATRPQETRREVNRIIDRAQVMYESNKHGFGALAVYRGDGEFKYAYWKSSGPAFEGGLLSFLENNLGAWRWVFHARLATAGAKDVDATHPIVTHSCDECEASLVVHNGHVNDHEKAHDELADDGHDFQTQVDSEVIAHSVDEFPDELSEDTDFSDGLHGKLNYILFGKDSIFVRNEGKYTLTDDLRISLRQRRDWVDDGDYKRGFALFHPDGTTEFQSKSYTSRRSTASGWTGYQGVRGMAAARNYTYGNRSDNGSDEDDSDSDSDSDQNYSREAWMQGRDETRGVWSGKASRNDSRAGTASKSSCDEGCGIDATDPAVDEDDFEAYLSDHDGWYEAGDMGYCFQHDYLFEHACQFCADEVGWSGILGIPMLDEIPEDEEILAYNKLSEDSEDSSTFVKLQPTVCDEHGIEHLAPACPECESENRAQSGSTTTTMVEVATSDSE